jgi:hypothetical protein
LESTTLLPLEYLFHRNSGRLSEFQQVGITATAELMLFSTKTLMETEGCTPGTAICVKEVFAEHDIRQRGDDESISDAIVRLFGPAGHAPIKVLNFITVLGQPIFAPLTAMMEFVNDSYPDVHVIEQLTGDCRFEVNETLLNEWDKLNVRLTRLSSIM